MFEHRQEEMQTLLKTHDNFRRLYDKHQTLEKRVTEYENGTAPIGDVDVNKLKREKLSIKDELTRIMDQTEAA